jgi:hypothetical protein
VWIRLRINDSSAFGFWPCGRSGQTRKPLGQILMAEGFPLYLTKYHLTVHGVKSVEVIAATLPLGEAWLPNALSNGQLPQCT